MPLSPKMINSVFLPETSERDVYLITVTHPSWTEPIRLSTDPTEVLGSFDSTHMPRMGTRSRGNVYEYVPINVIEPDAKAETPPAAKLSIENVSRIISPYLLTIDRDVPKVTIELCLASSPDTIDIIYPELDLSQITIDMQTVEGTIGMDVSSSEPIPWLRFVPAYFPNITG